MKKESRQSSITASSRGVCWGAYPFTKMHFLFRKTGIQRWMPCVSAVYFMRILSAFSQHCKLQRFPTFQRLSNCHCVGVNAHFLEPLWSLAGTDSSRIKGALPPFLANCSLAGCLNCL